MALINFIYKAFTKRSAKKQIEKDDEYIQPTITQITPHMLNADLEDESIVYDGLVLGEIVLLGWIGGNKINRKIPKYFKYAHFLDIEKSMEKLYTNGFKLKGTSKKCLTKKAMEVLDVFYFIPDNKNCRAWMLKAIEYVNSKDYKPSNDEIDKAILEIDLNKHIKDYLAHSAHGNFYSAEHSLSHVSYLFRKRQEIEKSNYYSVLSFIFATSGWGNWRQYHAHSNLYRIMIMSSIKCPEDLQKAGSIKKIFESAWRESERQLPSHYLSKRDAFKCLIAVINNNDSELSIFFKFKD